MLFSGCNAFLSNTYTCEVTDGKVIYHSSEAWFKAEQARAAGQNSLADRVSASDDPFEIMRMTRDLRQTKDWVKNEVDIMYSILRAKFDQNAELKTKLLNIRGDMFEATTNRKWGIGKSMAACLSVSGKQVVFDGENRLGKLLGRLREEYGVQKL